MTAMEERRVRVVRRGIERKAMLGGISLFHSMIFEVSLLRCQEEQNWFMEWQTVHGDLYSTSLRAGFHRHLFTPHHCLTLHALPPTPHRSTFLSADPDVCSTPQHVLNPDGVPRYSARWALVLCLRRITASAWSLLSRLTKRAPLRGCNIT